jgi:glucose 1-dehydrogenase
MTLTLTNQTAIVTGASSGIGKGVALALAEAGARVVVDYVGPSTEADVVVKEIQSRGGTAIAVPADVGHEADVIRLFDTAVQEFGTVDILVANAGIQRDAALIDMTLDQWNKVITVNLTGQFLCAREAVRRFLKQGIRKDVSTAAGKIICMSSVHQVIPWAGHVNYAASKGGVSLMMQSIAQEVARHRIRVNSIAPGAVQTPINKPAWETPDALNTLLTLIPSGRIGQPQDIASAAVWLASDASDYVQGTTLFVDGGMTLFPGFTEHG